MQVDADLLRSMLNDRPRLVRFANELGLSVDEDEAESVILTRIFQLAVAVYPQAKVE